MPLNSDLSLHRGYRRGFAMLWQCSVAEYQAMQQGSGNRQSSEQHKCKRRVKLPQVVCFDRSPVIKG
jgi:hypothetical protein